MNRAKLQHSVSELYKINNQIRVELNHIRYTREQHYPDRSPNVSKRIFKDKIGPTSLLGRDKSAQLPAKERSIKVYPKGTILNSDFNKATERRHYDHKFADQVQLELNLRKKSSSYLQLRTQAAKGEAISPVKHTYNTSLLGIGSSQKSVSKGGKRIIYNYHIYKDDLI